jgi:hypothetical protein
MALAAGEGRVLPRCRAARRPRSGRDHVPRPRATISTHTPAAHDDLAAVLVHPRPKELTGDAVPERKHGNAGTGVLGGRENQEHPSRKPAARACSHQWPREAGQPWPPAGNMGRNGSFRGDWRGGWLRREVGRGGPCGLAAPLGFLPLLLPAERLAPARSDLLQCHSPAVLATRIVAGSGDQRGNESASGPRLGRARSRSPCAGKLMQANRNIGTAYIACGSV